MSRHYSYPISEARDALDAAIKELRQSDDQRARWVASQFEATRTIARMSYSDSWTPAAKVAIKEYALAEVRQKIDGHETEISELQEAELVLLAEWEKEKTAQMDAEQSTLSASKD